jgi:MFS family permease
MGRILADVTPLRESADFRRFLSGQVLSVLGSQLTIVALRFQTYNLAGGSPAHRTFMVGMLGLVQLVPLVVASILGGPIADSHDRRKILLVTQTLLAACSAVLALNARSARPHLWLVFVMAATLSALIGIDWPTRNALVPGLVRESLLAKTIALNMIVYNFGSVVGPVVAGFLVAASIPLAFGLDALSYLFLLARIRGIAPQPPKVAASRKGLRAVADGMRYLRSQRTIQASFAADLGAMIFGVPDALFPAMATEVFGGGAHTLGFLQAAPAFGALLGGLTSGWTARIRRSGVAVVWCIVVWGVAIAAFGASRWLPLALVCLAIAGAADVVSALFRTLIVQTTVPDEYRGRLTAVFIAVVRGGPRLGEFESGMATSIGGLRFAAVSGGLACLGWIALVAAAYPELRTYVAPPADP